MNIEDLKKELWEVLKDVDIEVIEKINVETIINNVKEGIKLMNQEQK